MERENRRDRLRTAMATVMLCSACALVPQHLMAQQANQDLAGTKWRLVSLTMSGQTMTPDDRQKYMLSFEKNGRLGIHADCNKGKGRYTDPTGTLEIDKVVLTKAKCAPGSLADQFARALGFTQSYTIRDGNLLLGISPTGDTLQFEPSHNKR